MSQARGLQTIRALLLVAAAVPAHKKHGARHGQDVAEGRQRQHEQSQKTKTNFASMLNESRKAVVRSLEVKHAKRGHEQTVTGWNGKGRVTYVDRREKRMKE